MSETFTLPPGCQGFTTAAGEVLKPNSNGTITLEDNHAARLMRSGHRANGLISRQSHRLGTKNGRWCVACRRLWQAWSIVCPKCGDETLAEKPAQSAAPASAS